MIDARAQKVTGIVHFAVIRAPGLAPNAKRTRRIKDHESIVSIDAARRVLGYRPR